MSAPIVKCPTCDRPLEWSPASPFRPFCSERCRLIDLGAWLSEERSIAGESSATPPPADESEKPEPDSG